MKSERELWLEKRVEELERDRDAMVEEAADEQTRSIKAALMDEMHDHALDCDLLRISHADRDEWRDTARSEMAGRAAAEAEVARLRAASDEDARALLHLNDLLTTAEAEVERLRAALVVGVTAVVNLCTHLYLTPVEAHWHGAVRQDLGRMRAALAPEVEP